MGVPDERFEEKELRIAELEEKVEALEKENFRYQQEAKTQTNFPKAKGLNENEKLL